MFSAPINYHRLFFYYEPCFFSFSGKLGSFKFRISNLFYALFDRDILKFIKSILIRTTIDNNCLPFWRYAMLPVIYLINHYGSLLHNATSVLVGLIMQKISQIIFSITHGWNIRLRFAGIGYKVYNTYGLLIFKLGYSHYFIYLLPYEVQGLLIGRKKRGILLFSLNKMVLVQICRFIISLRLLSPYTGKGIRLRGISFIRKEGKKSQF